MNAKHQPTLKLKADISGANALVGIMQTYPALYCIAVGKRAVDAVLNVDDPLNDNTEKITMKKLKNYEMYRATNGNIRYRADDKSWYQLGNSITNFGFCSVTYNEGIKLEKQYQELQSEKAKEVLKDVYVGSDHSYMGVKDENTDDIVFNQKTEFDESIQYDLDNGFSWQKEAMKQQKELQPTPPANPMTFQDFQEYGGVAPDLVTPTRPSEDDMISPSEPRLVKRRREAGNLAIEETFEHPQAPCGGKVPGSRPNYTDIGLRVDRENNLKIDSDVHRDRVNQIVALQDKVSRLDRDMEKVLASQAKVCGDVQEVDTSDLHGSMSKLFALIRQLYDDGIIKSEHLMLSGIEL